MRENPLDPSSRQQEDHWIALSDLMTGLMLIFMLIAIAFMVRVEVEKFKVKQIAILYDQVRRDLYADLMKEFGPDLPRWGAEISKDLTVRFNKPEILFDVGASDLKPKFQDILLEFFPRYMNIIMAPKYRDAINEVRIEGHTSSLWAAPISADEAYFKNMELSQSRTRSTLRYIMSLPAGKTEYQWLRNHVTANGLSSSHPILDANNHEDVERSQRVEFHIHTDAAGSIANILETLK